MRHEPPVRSRTTSIWQSAKFDNVRDWTTARNTRSKPPTAFRSTQKRTTADKPSGAAAKAPTLFTKLTDLVGRYSTLDFLGWAQCELQYLRYKIEARFPKYNDWTAQSPADLSYGMIEYRLPATCKVLLIGDWGTRMTDNVAMLRQALKMFAPEAIIHLGDVYYSGTPQECTQNVIKVMDELIDELKIKRPPFFMLPGNHDYYSGGRGFYGMLTTINSTLPGCEQKASYFCLRTHDDRWQFLGMDTGYNDRDPIAQKTPGLVPSEITWHRDKLEHFPGTTVLLSHHQLFSAKETLSKGANPCLNENLHATFQPYFDRTAAWFWGHEHNLIIFKDGLSFAGDTQPLRKGRLVGCSAYEESLAEDPYGTADACKAATFIENMPKLGLSKYKSETQQFYNHAFALLEVSPIQIKASYYEYPSWDQEYAPPDPPIMPPVFTEVLPLIRHP